METVESKESEQVPIIVEVARPEDAEEMVHVHNQSWLETYPNEEHGISEEDIRHRLAAKAEGKVERYRKMIETQRDSDHAAFVARQNGTTVGIALPYVEGDGRRRLGALYVLKRAHGTGAGSQLLGRALQWHGNNDVYLQVTSYNERAKRFYEKHGFEFTGKEGFEEVGDVKMPVMEMVRRKQE
ncbi:GNAT family N-acetyltransferase [Candidatus Berkelbacteria bacterium]|nr:GNAT family N-acetyltransferase [Candidatus Berkelbacteria bacterium]